jgi:hypothetical protein
MGDHLKAVISIETALKHHIRPVLDGDKIDLRKTEGHEQANKDDVALVMEILKANKAELLEFLTSRETIQGILQLSQQKLIRDQEQFFQDMEWWDKLERVYEAVWPLDECVNGDDQCPDNAIVRCSYCVATGISKRIEE